MPSLAEAFDRLINSQFGNKPSVRFMWHPDLAVEALSNCSQTAPCVSELVAEIRGNHERTIRLIEELETRGLLRRTLQNNSRGRPKHLLQTTPLGKLFLAQYRELLRLSLQSNDNDLMKAIRQAEMAQRLVEQGVSPYRRLREVNEIARNIARTAQINRGPR